MVFYRKYRPQRIDDLDSKSVRDTLYSVLKNSAPHAFLFTGPKGLGKTSTARIIAKAVNCERRARSEEHGAKSTHSTRSGQEEQRAKSEKEITLSPTPSALSDIEPCNQCDQCVSITNGTNLDVLEIDAASNRGIDEIRDLKEKIRLSPVAAKMKVYIIDEVHMLTTEAFNALLKTLEEPPAHAMFVLCTTEPHKVPATIMSRCLHIAFSLATTEELVRSFKRIAVGEKIAIDEEVLAMIAELADGGFRDGAKILEEIVSLANGEKITKELVEGKYQVSSIRYQVLRIIDVFVKKDMKTGLEIVSKLVEQGVDMKYFLQALMDELHRQMLEQVGVGQRAEGKGQGAKITIDEIRVLFELLSKANMDMKYAVLPQLPLELAIIEFTTQNSAEQNAEPSENSGLAPHVSKEGVTVSSLRKQVGTIKKIQALYGDKSKKESVEKEEIPTTKVALMHASPNGHVTQEWMDAFWKQLISEMKQHNHTIAGLLRGCIIKSFDKKILVIQTNYKFHKERLDDIKTRDALMKISKLLTGNDVEVKVELRT
jgi:DNA polymerase-3 subunit gamma/tau